MAQYCFWTTLILSVIAVLAGIINCVTKKAAKGLCVVILLSGVVVIGNCIFIPCVLFSDYSKQSDCVGTIDPVTGKLILDGPLATEYKFFKLIWILISCVSVLFVFSTYICFWC